MINLWKILYSVVNTSGIISHKKRSTYKAVSIKWNIQFVTNFAYKEKYEIMYNARICTERITD